MKNLTQLPWSGKGSKAKNDNTLGRMRGGIRSRIGSMSLKNTSLFGVILTLLLTFGVGEMWAVNFTGGKIYFRNDVTNWTQNNIQIFAHQSGYTWVSSSMSAVSNTKLYYVNASCDWGGFTSYRICGNSSAWGSGSFTNQSTSTKYTGANSSYGLNSGSIYLITPASSSNGCAISPVYYSSNDNFLKYTATAKVKTSTNGSSYTTVTSGTWPATVNIKGTYLSGDGATTRSDVATSSGSAGTYDVVATGLVTLTYSSLSSDWSFAGWGTGDTPSSTNESYEYNISAATTVYAFFKKKYTVTFNANGHGSAPSSQKVVVGGKASTPSAPTATGYTFGGWYEEAECSNAWNFSTGTITEDKTLYAKWTAKTYSITLDDNGDYQGNGSATATYGSATLAVTDHAERDDWNLVGYWTASGSGGSQVSDASGNLIASVSGYTDSNGKWIKDATCSLYAHWSQSYSVTYNANGGTGTTTDASSPYTPGSDVTVLSNSFTRTGYTFTGWNTSAEGDGTPYAAGETISSIAANVTLYAQWSEKKTTVTISASPAGTGTFTVNSVSGTSASVGVTTTATIVATPATDFEFTSWAATNCSASPTNNKSTTLTGNGSSASGTLVATFTENVASGWYLGGTDFGNSWDVGNTAYPLTKKYRGMAGVFYRQGTVTTAAYDALHNGTTRYRPTSNATFSGAGWSNKISLSSTTANANYRFKTAGTYYIIADTRGATPVIWYETSEPDRNNYHSVNVTGVVNAKGTCKVTLGSTSGFETTRFANGETFYVTITGVSGWIPTITIGGVATTFNKEAATYTASGTMSTSDVTVAISYTASYTVTYEVGTVKGNKNDIKLYVGSIASGNIISSGTKVKSGTEVFFWVNNNTTESEFCKPGYNWWGFRNAPAGTDPTQYTNASVTVYHPYITANTTVYAVFGEKDYTVKIINNGNGDVYEGGSIVTATTAHVATASNTLTATPQTGYYFTGWDQFSDSLTINSASTAATTIKIKSDKLGDNARLRANYSPRWSVLGTDAFGGWSAYSTNLFTGYTKVSTKDVGYKTITLAANTNYEIKVYDRENSTWYGGSANQNIDYSHSGSGNEYTIATTSSPKSVFIKSAAGGTYTLNWNLTDKKIAVVYPTSWYITTGVNDALGGSFTAVDNSSNNVYGGKFVANSANVVFTATPNTGYNFSGWYSNSTCTTPYTAGTSVAFSGEGNTVMTLSGITADKTVYAKFTTKEYTIALDMQTSAEGYGSGSNRNESVTYNATLTTVGSLPTAANGYAFMGFYSGTGGKGTQFINASGTWATSVTDTISDSKWVLDAGAILYAYYKKAEITELTLVDAIVAQNVTNGVKVTPTISPTPAGTTHIDWRVLYSNGNPLASQPSMTAYNTTGVQFTSPETSGTYLIEAVLRTGSTANAGMTIDSTTASFQVAGEHTVTIQYKCGDDVIASSTSMTGKPLEWTEVVAHKIFGYTYSSMTAGDGVTLRDTTAARLTELQAEDPTIVAVKRMKAVYDGKLTINYTQNQMIYFKNTLGWSDVYVNFYTSSYWNNPKGSGNNNVTNRNKHMTRIGETDVWYYDYGAASITPSLYVSFTSVSQENYENFSNANVVYPANYQDDIHTDKSAENGFKAAVPMFVPLANQEKTTLNSNAKYYNRGYWTKYLPGTGYTLEIYNSAGNVLLKSFEFTSADELMPMKAVADLEAATTYTFQIRRGGTSSAGIYYGNKGSMTSSNNGNGNPWELINTMTPSFTKVTIKTTAAGDYTFNLSYSENASSQYRLRIAVDYPAATGDFQVLYSDTTTWSNGKHAAAWRHPSRVITHRANGKDTISFFVYKGKKPAINARKISTINASTGAITWTATNIGSNASQSLDAVEATGVYNFVVTQNAAGTAITSVENIGEYTGNYYIRTDAANNKWDSYRSLDHMMTYSEYSKTYSDYTHYFMAYVGNGTNIKFTIANDYSACVTDTLIQQTFRGGDASHVDAFGNVQADANVRFMWDTRYNRLIRAYLAAAKNDGSKFLVLRASSSSDMTDPNGNALLESANSGQAGYNHKAPDNSIQFVDNENWIYETNVKVLPGAYVKLYAYFNSAYFYYKGENNDTFDESNAIQILGGSGTAQLIRVIYDFKTDRLVAAWEPSGEINGERAIKADVMFVREHQGDIAQLTFTESGKITKINTAYGVLRFNKWTLNNKSKADGHAPLSPALSRYERDLFYVSFPFRVAMNEVFGFGTYGTHWIIEYYDGAARAASGYWAETPTFWRYVTDRKGKYFEPNQGYIIALDLDELGESSEVWANDVENVELYFPSYGTMDNITASEITHELPAHKCTIGPRPGMSDDRRIKDSHWNIMSVPTYVNTSNIAFANTSWTATRPNFLYEWNPSDNSLTARSGIGYTYHAMHAYTVQYAGNVTWTSSVNVSPVVARRQNKPQELEFRIELRQDNTTADQTFVRMSNNEQVSTEFVFGEDMSKEFNGNKANIYTMVSTMIDGDLLISEAAGNVLPMSEQTTVVPVGVKIATNGDYTFSIPEGTEGVGVTLIDQETGIRTSLSALAYTVSLEAGTYDERFVLEISPIHNVPTEQSAVSDQQSDVRKVLIDGLLYIVRDNKMYDARGAMVMEK